MGNIQIKTVIGSELLNYIPELARLRIKIFREYPYLYEGSMEYEEKYLQTYSDCEEAMAVILLDNGEVIGASTGLPLVYETEEFKKPFLEMGVDIEKIFYCGESILLPEYRGKGLYKEFFKGREEYARSLIRLEQICFCGVVREADDERKPNSYIPLDDTWRHFGYSPVSDCVSYFSWKEIDGEQEIEHPMQFWMKRLEK